MILAHRLLKNSIESNEYLLITEAAFELMDGQLVGHFEPREESYEDFGRVPLRVRYLEPDFLAARDALYELGAPVRAFSWRDRLMMVWEAVVGFRLMRRRIRWAIPAEQLARGRRRTEWAAPPAGASAD